ncbi:MAG: YHS domain-containing protein [Bacteroidota bacterium]
MARDPVCGMELKGGSALKVEYQNQTYFFCSNDCKMRFEAEPSKYVAKSKDPMSEHSSHHHKHGCC